MKTVIFYAKLDKTNLFLGELTGVDNLRNIFEELEKEYPKHEGSICALVDGTEIMFDKITLPGTFEEMGEGMGEPKVKDSHNVSSGNIITQGVICRSAGTEEVSVKYEDRRKKLEELSKPLIHFMKEEFNPYCSVEITSEGAKIVEDIMYSPIVTTQE